MVVAVIDSGLDVNHEVLRITDPSKAKFKTKEKSKLLRKRQELIMVNGTTTRLSTLMTTLMVPTISKEAERGFSQDARYRDCNRNPDKEAGNGEKIYGVAPEAGLCFACGFQIVKNNRICSLCKSN